MKTMNDIKALSDTDLAAFIRERRVALRDARFNPTAQDMKTIRGGKVELARALTEQTRRRTTASKTT